MAQADERRGAGDRSREGYWRVQVEAWEKSGWSQAEFCRRRGLSAASLSWWKSELRRRGEGPGVGVVARARRRRRPVGPAEAGSMPVRPGLLPVRVVASGPRGAGAVGGGEEGFALEVVLRGGVRVRVGRGFAVEELRRVVEALQGVAC